MARARQSPNWARASSPAARKGTKGLKRAFARRPHQPDEGQDEEHVQGEAAVPAIWIPR